MEKPTILFLTLFTSILLLFTIFSTTTLPQKLSLSSSPVLENFLSLFINHEKLSNEEADTYTNFNEVEEKEARIQSLFPNELHVSKDEINFDDEDVVVLTKDNFNDFVSKNRYVMINFYASWCYFSNKLSPQYALAAKMLKSNNSKVVLAIVDCIQETELARMFEIKGYPTIYFLIGAGSEKIQYDPKEERTSDAIVNWVNNKVNVAVQTLTTMEEIERVLNMKPVIVLGFLDSLEGPEAQELDAVSKSQIDVDFYQTTNEDVAKKFSFYKRPALVLWRRDDKFEMYYEDELTRSAVDYFVSLNKAPSTSCINEDSPRIVIRIPDFDGSNEIMYNGKSVLSDAETFGEKVVESIGTEEDGVDALMNTVLIKLPSDVHASEISYFPHAS